MIHGSVHKHAVQDATRIGAQTKGNVAYAQDGLDLGQRLLDAPYGV